MQSRKYKSEIRAALIAGCVAFAVAAPLSSAAEDGVRSAVKIVKGKQGKRGPRGRTGAVGPTGPQGVPGKDATLAPRTDPQDIWPGDTVTLVVKACPPDKTTDVVGFVKRQDGSSPDPLPTKIREGVGSDGPIGRFGFMVIENTTDELLRGWAGVICTTP